MGVPNITVQVAWTNTPGDASKTWVTVHETDSPRRNKGVVSMEYQRGVQNELSRMEAGTARLVIADEESDYDADNTASPYSPNVRPMRPIRAYAVIDGVTYNLFRHLIEQLPRTRSVTTVYTERSLLTVDGFELLARASLAGKVYAQELTGTRITNVLTDIAWPAAESSIDAGNSTVAAKTFAADDDTAALTHLLDVAELGGEQGLLYIGGDGLVRFIQRHSLVASPYTVSQATFHDARSGGGGYPFVDAEPVYGVENVFNDWAGTRAGGTTQTATDAASKTAYGRRSKVFTSIVTTDAAVKDQCEWNLREFKDARNRLGSITVMPGDDSAMWAAVLGLEVGDRVTVVEQPPGLAAPVSKQYIIHWLRAEFPPGPLVGARFTFDFGPADLSPWLVLDDVTVGKLDTGLVGY